MSDDAPQAEPASSETTDGPHPAGVSIDVLLKSCESQRFRASGPGGQHRNKVETAVRLTHRPTGITAQATEQRSQEANRQKAIFRLRVNLALSVRRPPPPASPSDRWTTRVRGGRLAINPNHEDFPALLAEALDQVAFQNYDLSAAVQPLEVSVSQLLKLLRHEPRALQQVNDARRAAGLKAMR